jgi:hypothetical protein
MLREGHSLRAIEECQPFRGITGCSERFTTHSSEMAEELAKQAWFVRVQTVGSSEPIALEFAVGTNISQDAIAAVLNHAEVALEDQVTSTAQLTAIEIRSFRLRPNEVRTYGRRFYNASAGRWVPGQAAAR